MTSAATGSLVPSAPSTTASYASAALCVSARTGADRNAWMTVGLATVLVYLYCVDDLRAGTFNDSFVTDPYANGRWCERHHDVTWSGSLQLMLGINSSVCAGAPCCNGCPPGQSCSSAPNTLFHAITTLAQEPLTSGRDRTASILFAFPSPHFNPALGQHLAMLPITHPNCHANVQIIVNPVPPGGIYQLGIGVINDFLAGFDDAPDYCDGTFGTIVFSSATTTLTLQTTPRYKVTGHVYLPNAPPSLYGIARSTLIDTQTGATLLTEDLIGFTAPLWFNTAAKRYGFAAIRPTGTTQVRFDGFLSTAF